MLLPCAAAQFLPDLWIANLPVGRRDDSVKDQISVRHFDGEIEIEEVAEGLLVRQCGEAYVARNWRLTRMN